MKEPRDRLAGEETLALRARVDALEDTVRSEQKRVAQLEEIVTTLTRVRDLPESEPETIRKEAQEGRS